MPSRTGCAVTRSNPSGFTIVEVTVASAVMLIGVLGLLVIFIQAFNTTAKSGHRSIINHLAIEKIESLRALDYADASLSIGIHPALQTDSNGLNYYPVAGQPEYISLRWVVTAGPTDSTGTAVATMKTVVIEVTHMVRYTGSHLPILGSKSRQVAHLTFLHE